MSDYDNINSLNDCEIFFVDRETIKDELYERFDAEIAKGLEDDDMFIYAVLDDCANRVAEFFANSQIQTVALSEAV